MSTSLLYHAFGLKGYVHQRIKYVGGEICFLVEQSPSRLRCSACRSRHVIRRGGRRRRFRGLPIGRRRVWIELTVPRLECKKCGVVRQAEISFARGQHGYTKRFARYVLDLARSMTMWDTAEHLGVSWNLVKELLKEALRRRFARPRLKDLRLLAIDEISIGRGHRYLTVVLDLETGAVVFVGNGKGAEAHKAVLKGTRWLLLKNPDKLDEARDEAKRLQAAIELNEPLATAYYLKEDLRQLWSQPNKTTATEFLEGWIARARSSGIRQMIQISNTLSLRRAGLVAYYDVPISTGPLEGTNNKIKTLQRQAYGYRDQEFLRLRIFALHATRYELVG